MGALLVSKLMIRTNVPLIQREPTPLSTQHQRAIYHRAIENCAVISSRLQYLHSTYRVGNQSCRYTVAASARHPMEQSWDGLVPDSVLFGGRRVVMWRRAMRRASWRLRPPLHGG